MKGWEIEHSFKDEQGRTHTIRHNGDWCQNCDYCIQIAKHIIGIIPKRIEC
jgi:hypothetical protein